MKHSLYGYTGVDNMMVLLERSQYIAEQIAVQQIDDFLVIPSCPNMVSTTERHDELFCRTH